MANQGDSRRRTAMEALKRIRDRGVDAGVEQGALCAGRLILDMGIDDWSWNLTKNYMMKAGTGGAESIALAYFDAAGALEMDTADPAEFDSEMKGVCRESGGRVLIRDAARRFSEKRGLRLNKGGAAVFVESASGWRSFEGGDGPPMKVVPATLSQSPKAYHFPQRKTGFTVATHPFIHFECG